MAVTTTGIWDALAEVEDPELPVAITDLGMVRSVTVEGTEVRVLLTPTFVGCPALEVIGERVRRRLCGVPGVEEVVVRFA
jgi:ring-1,2-phenylacetyl-CoA epoxidase subunit PaaD